MTGNSGLDIIQGYSHARERVEDLYKTGSDFTGSGQAVAGRIGKLHPKRLNLTLAKIVDETRSARTLRFTSDDNYLPPFLAGQYVNLFVTVDGVDTARPYAISSSPQERDYYDITVRRMAGGFVSRYLVDQIEVGARVQCSGPMGAFYVNPLTHGDDLVFLAGGSGVAPARAMIRDIAARNLAVKFHLIYGSRLTDDIIFAEELDALARAHDFLTVTQVISEPGEGFAGRRGFIDADVIHDLVGSVQAKTFYLCGPPAMNEFCAAALSRLGVAAKCVRIEANGPPSAPQSLPGWPEGVAPDKMVTVTIRGKGQFSMRAGEPLLNALERNGFGLENACRSGECSLCRVKILSGQVFSPHETKLRASDRQFGWVHACVAFPTQDVEVLI